jgi:hypothetical protein
MKNYLGQLCCAVVGIVIMSGAAVAPANADYGPLQTTNRFPLHLVVLTPRAVDAEPPEQGVVEATLALEYSNTYFNFRNARWDLLIDMEVLVADLSLVYGVSEKFALRLDLPLKSMQDGFMDGFLQNYHDFLGVPNYDREDRPKDHFAYRAAKDGKLWIQGDAAPLQLGEARFSTQFSLPSINIAGHPLNSSFLATVKIPTGDAGKGLGSERFDAGIFLPIHWKKGSRWSAYMMPGAIWIDDPKTLGAQVSARNSFSLLAGTAYEYNDKWRWLAQLNFYTSPFEKTGLDELDDGALELTFGFQRALSRSLYWEFAFGEDLTLAVPDFNIRLGMTWRFNSY